MPAPLTVRFLPSQADMDAALWDVCLPPPLEGRWWYEALEASELSDQFLFRYALVCRGEEAVGIAPLFCMDVPLDIVIPPVLMPLARLLGRVMPSLLHQRTLFVGSPCADEGSVGFVPGLDRRQTLLCLQQALKAEAKRLGASMIVWKDFPEAMSADLNWLAKKTGLFPMVSYPGTVADLPGPTKDDFFAAMKTTRRRNLRKKLRESAKVLPLETTVVQHPEGAELDAICRLFQNTYEHATTRFERLGRPFFTRMAALPHAFFIILRQAQTGDMLAFMLCFDMGDRIINKYIGLDYTRPKEWSLFFRLWEVVLDWSLAKGATSIQSGQTGYVPKMDMGHRLVPLTTYCRHRNPLVHGIYAAVAKRISWKTLDEGLAAYAATEEA